VCSEITAGLRLLGEDIDASSAACQDSPDGSAPSMRLAILRSNLSTQL
jgi:hypothetical protein